MQGKKRELKALNRNLLYPATTTQNNTEKSVRERRKLSVLSRGSIKFIARDKCCYELRRIHMIYIYNNIESTL